MTTQRSLDTNTSTLTQSSLAETRQIFKAIKRSLITRRYSHGTIKRSAMAMINYYIRLGNQGHNLHATM